MKPGKICHFATKIIKKAVYGASTLDEFVDICARDDVAYVDISNACYDNLADIYQVHFEGSNSMRFTATVSRVPLSLSPHEVYELENERGQLRTYIYIRMAARKLESKGVVVFYFGEPFEEERPEIDFMIKDYLRVIRSHKKTLGLRRSL